MNLNNLKYYNKPMDAESYLADMYSLVNEYKLKMDMFIDNPEMASKVKQEFDSLKQKKRYEFSKIKV